MADSPLLDGLNEAQRQAVAAGEGPHLILAGPGSGKTRVLTHRVAYLIREMGVRPYHIMAVTFTNKAAREMKGRIYHMLSAAGEASEDLSESYSGLVVGTFHATCARFLRVEAEHGHYSRDYVIYDTRDQRDACKRAALELGVDIKRFTPRSLLNAISGAKNELLTPEIYADRVETYYGEVAARVYGRYQQLLREANAMDFDDLLMQTVDLFQRRPEVAEKYQARFEYVLVDEFQDTNFAQYMLVRALALPQDNVFAVGDPDQSIYAFRGADHRNVLRFEHDFPEARTILLEQNYRSTQNILDAAVAVINRNPNRTPKRLFTDRGAGESLAIYEAYDEDDEANYVVGAIHEMNENALYNPGECAVMYRTNAQSLRLETAFRSAGIPYHIYRGRSFYDRKEIKDLTAFLRLVENPNDTVALERVINLPPRGIGAKTLQALFEWAAERGLQAGVTLLSLRAGAEGPFNSRAARALEGFADLLAGWQALVEAGQPPQAVLDAVITDIGYERYLRTGDPEGEDRWENVLELRAQTADPEFTTLTDFLTDAALKSDADTPDEEDAVALMTLHSAKGLEFPVVFIAGLEDGTLPHSRSVEADQNGDTEALPEERRLLYVGLTRAKDRLHLSYAFRRARYGFEPAVPSRFLYDLPAEAREGSPLAAAQARREETYQRMTAWAADLPTVVGRKRASAAGGPGQAHPEAPPPRFRTGQSVVHPVFGEGVVLESKRYGSTEEVDVEFSESGRKRIDGGFLAPLGE